MQSNFSVKTRFLPLLVLWSFACHVALGGTSLDKNGWTPWLEPSEVGAVVEEFHDRRLANDIGTWTYNRHTKFVIQWLHTKTGDFDLRLSSDSDFIEKLKRKRQSTNWILVKEIVTDPDPNGVTWRIALWHKGLTPHALFSKVDALLKTPDYGRAVAPAEQLVRSAEGWYGPDNISTAGTWARLGMAYLYSSSPEKALEPLERGLKIYAGTESLNSVDAIRTKWMRARCLRLLGRYDEARSDYQTILEYWRKTDGERSLNVAKVLSDLGTVVSDDDPAQAQGFYLDSLQIAVKLGAEANDLIADVRHNLADLYRKLGDLDKAESQLLSVKEHDDHASRSNLEATNTLRALASIRVARGDAAGAEKYLRKALLISEKLERPKGRFVALCLGDLSNLRADSGKLREADDLLKQDLAITRSVYGEVHRENAVTLHNLGRLALDQNKPSLAAKRFEEALAIRDRCGTPKGSYTRRDTIGWLAIANLSLGRRSEAIANADEALRLDYAHWVNLLFFAPERQRRAARNVITPFDLPAMLGDGTLAAKAVLLLKGAAFDADFQERRISSTNTNPQLLSTWKRIQVLRERLRGIEISQALGSKEASTDAIEDELEGLERTLLGPTLTSDVSLNSDDVLAKVQRQLPESAALVEIFRYSRWQGKSHFRDCYAAVVIGHDRPAACLELGDAKALDKLITQFRSIVGTNRSERLVKTETDIQVLDLSRALYRAIAEPIERAIPPKTTQLIVSADGELHFVPFSMLVARDGQFWGDTIRLTLISSGRDLIWSRTTENASGKVAVLFGHPDYDMAVGDVDAKNPASPISGARSEPASSPSISDADRTDLEIDGVEAQLKLAGWACQCFCDSFASKSAVRQIKHPDILHFATHGFYLPENLISSHFSDRILQRISDPMQRSGLALAGALTTSRLWSLGQAPPDPSADGVLTAAEVAELDLVGTSLVTLSVCDSALGQNNRGEGVFGLERAFLLAGARQVLVTLWPINDSETVGIMLNFYGQIAKGVAPPEALRIAQSSALTRLRREHGLQYALNRVAPFIIVER